jgi:hypothetical protein
MRSDVVRSVPRVGRRWRVAAAALVGTLGLTLAGVAAVGAKSAGRPDSGTAWVAVTHTVGSTLYLAGDSTDKVLGNDALTYTVKAGTAAQPGTVTTSGTVTVFSKTGSLSGPFHGTAVTTSTGSVTETGTADLSHGTGGQKGHSEVGTFTGTGASPTGPFVFHTKGTYK